VACSKRNIRTIPCQGHPLGNQERGCTTRGKKAKNVLYVNRALRKRHRNGARGEEPINLLKIEMTEITLSRVGGRGWGGGVSLELPPHLNPLPKGRRGFILLLFVRTHMRVLVIFNLLEAPLQAPSGALSGAPEQDLLEHEG